MKIDEIYMSEAIKEAGKAIDEDEVPVGVVIVHNRRIIARAHNQTRMLKDPTAHAEIMAIRAACQKLETHSLKDCVIYSSCEPCPMCFAAILWANLSGLYFAATRKDAADIGFQDNALHALFRVPPRTKWPLPTNPQWPSWRARNDAIKMMKAWKGASY